MESIFVALKISQTLNLLKHLNGALSQHKYVLNL